MTKGVTKARGQASPEIRSVFLVEFGGKKLFLRQI